MPRLADLLIVVGAVTAIAGAVVAAFAYVRYFRSGQVQTDATARAVSGLELAYGGAVAAVILGVGIQVLLLGLAWRGSIDVSGEIFLPAGMALGGAYLAWWTRRYIARLRRSR